MQLMVLNPVARKRERRGNPGDWVGEISRPWRERKRRNPGPAQGYRMFHEADPDRAYKALVPDSFPEKLYMIGRLVKLQLAGGGTITGGVLCAGGGNRMYIVGARKGGPAGGRAVQVEYIPPKASRKHGACYYHKFKRPPAVRRVGAGGYYTVAGKGVMLTPRGIVG